MIHEYAVEPDLLNTWEQVSFLLPHFGIDHGRLIVKYPHQWEAEVLR